MLIIAATAMILVSGAYAGDTFTWTGADGGNTNWNDADNWSGAAGYPGDGVGGVKDDIAKIPGSLADNKYPVVFNDDDITIKRLEIEGKAGEDDLVFLSDDASHKLRIDTHPTGADPIAADKAALSIGTDGVMKLQEKSELWFTSSEIETFVIDIDGTLEFADGTGDDMPELVIGDGKTVTIEDDGVLKGTSGGRITGEVGNPDCPDTLVLGSDAQMKGSFVIDTILYNHGYVHTGDTTPGTIELTCHPKGGTGHWHVDGGTSSEALSRLIVNTNVGGCGYVEVYNFGVLSVNRHMSVSTNVFREAPGPRACGYLYLTRGGKIEVQKGIRFEIDRFDTVDCPVIE